MSISEPLHLSVPKDAWRGSDTTEVEDGQFLLLLNYCPTFPVDKQRNSPECISVLC